MKEELGKITDAEFRIVWDMPHLMGLVLVFESETGLSVGSHKIVNMNPECNYETKEHRSKALSDNLEEIYDILNEAKVQTINQLVGIPVRLYKEGHVLKDWKILMEVL